MNLTGKNVDSLNFCLDDLSVEGAERFDLAEFAAVDVSRICSPKLLGTCAALCEKLTFYSEEMHFPNTGNEVSLNDLYSHVAPLGPAFKESADFLSYR